MALLFCKASQLAVPLAWEPGSTCFTPQRLWPLLRSFSCVGGRSSHTTQGGGSGAELGEQLPAMLRPSGHWLRSCGENHAAFLRPISLDRPVGNRGQWNEEICLPFLLIPNCLPFLSTHCLQASAQGCCFVCLLPPVFWEQQSMSIYLPPPQSVQPWNRTLSLTHQWSLQSQSEELICELLGLILCNPERDLGIWSSGCSLKWVPEMPGSTLISHQISDVLFKKSEPAERERSPNAGTQTCVWKNQSIYRVEFCFY